MQAAWPIVSLSDVAAINPRRPTLKVAHDTLVSFVPMAAVSEATASIEKMELKAFREVSKGFTFFEEGDLLLAKITPCMENGKAAVAENLETGVGFGSTEFHVLRPVLDVVDRRFLLYFLRRSEFRAHAKQAMRGAVGQQRVPKEFLESYKIPLPPPSEQLRIVEILDQADELRKKRAKADAKAARILPALFYKMFGDPVTNPMGWSVEPLEDLVEIGTQLVDPNLPEYRDLVHIGGEHIEKDTGRIYSLKSVKESNLKSGKYIFSEKHILYSKIRPYLNKVAWPRIAGVCSADIYPLCPKNDKVSQWYLLALLQSQAFLDYAKIHSERLRMPKLNREQLGAFSIPVPSPQKLKSFNLQVNELTEIDRYRLCRNNSVEDLMTVLLSRAFCGSLTSNWRKTNELSLLAEMKEQAKYIGA